MATINLGEKKKRERRPRRDSDEKARRDRQKVYQSKRYRTIRELKRYRDPVCQICALKGIVRGVEHVHHWRSPFRHKDDPALFNYLAYSYENLASLCEECHISVHHGELAGCESMSDVEDRLEQLKNKKTIYNFYGEEDETEQ